MFAQGASECALRTIVAVPVRIAAKVRDITFDPTAGPALHLEIKRRGDTQVLLELVRCHEVHPAFLGSPPQFQRVMCVPGSGVCLQRRWKLSSPLPPSTLTVICGCMRADSLTGSFKELVSGFRKRLSAFSGHGSMSGIRTRVGEVKVLFKGQKVARRFLAVRLLVVPPLATNQNLGHKDVQMFILGGPGNFAIVREKIPRGEATLVVVMTVGKVPQHHLRHRFELAPVDRPMGGIVACCATPPGTSEEHFLRILCEPTGAVPATFRALRSQEVAAYPHVSFFVAVFLGQAYGLRRDTSPQREAITWKGRT